MITKQTLLQDENYQFKYIDINVLETNEQDEVMAFVAVFVKDPSNPMKLTEGLKEINRTLWNQDSPKRPDGYWVLKTHDGKSGVCKSVFVSDEWLDQHDEKTQSQKEQEWKLA